MQIKKHEKNTTITSLNLAKNNISQIKKYWLKNNRHNEVPTPHGDLHICK